MKRNYIVISLVFFVSILFIGTETVNAQRVQGGLTFNMGFPQGEFKDNMDNTMLGVALNVGVALGKSPFVAGVDLGFLNYGSDKRYESINNIPDLLMRIEHSYNIFQGLGFLRFQPVKKGPLQPYGEVLAGINYLWTETSLEGDGDVFEDDIIRSTNYDDSTFCWGFGGGVLVKLGGKRTGSHKKSDTEFFLDLKARYLFGGKAAYMQEDSIIVYDNEATYIFYESKTDLLNFQAGIAVKF